MQNIYAYDVTKQARIFVRICFIFKLCVVRNIDLLLQKEKRLLTHTHSHTFTNKSSWNGYNYRKFPLIKTTSMLPFARFPVNVWFNKTLSYMNREHLQSTHTRAQNTVKVIVGQLCDTQYTGSNKNIVRTKWRLH